MPGTDRAPETPDATTRRFVLHEHHKPRHHFDLRLEEDGVLRSWEEHDRNDRRMIFTLHGQRHARRYALIQTDAGALLHLTKDQPDP